eukprot:g24659.t1
MLLYCYALCVFVHPGTIPDKEEDGREEGHRCPAGRAFRPKRCDPYDPNGLPTVLDEHCRPQDPSWDYDEAEGPQPIAADLLMNMQDNLGYMQPHMDQIVLVASA